MSSNYESARSHDPSEPENLIQKLKEQAARHFSKGESFDALLCFERAINVAEGATNFQKKNTRDKIENGFIPIPQSRRVIPSGRRRNPEHTRLISELFSYKAMVLMKLQRFEQAILSNRRAIATDETNWKVLMRQAECFEAINDFQNACRFYELAKEKLGLGKIMKESKKKIKELDEKLRSAKRKMFSDLGPPVTTLSPLPEPMQVSAAASAIDGFRAFRIKEIFEAKQSYSYDILDDHDKVYYKDFQTTVGELLSQAKQLQKLKMFEDAARILTKVLFSFDAINEPELKSQEENVLRLLRSIRKEQEESLLKEVKEIKDHKEHKEFEEKGLQKNPRKKKRSDKVVSDAQALLNKLSGDTVSTQLWHAIIKFGESVMRLRKRPSPEAMDALQRLFNISAMVAVGGKDWTLPRDVLPPAAGRDTEYKKAVQLLIKYLEILHKYHNQPTRWHAITSFKIVHLVRHESPEDFDNALVRDHVRKGWMAWALACMDDNSSLDYANCVYISRRCLDHQYDAWDKYQRAAQIFFSNQQYSDMTACVEAMKAAFNHQRTISIASKMLRDLSEVREEDRNNFEIKRAEDNVFDTIAKVKGENDPISAEVMIKTKIKELKESEEEETEATKERIIELLRMMAGLWSDPSHAQELEHHEENGVRVLYITDWTQHIERMNLRSRSDWPDYPKAIRYLEEALRYGEESNHILARAELKEKIKQFRHWHELEQEDDKRSRTQARVDEVLNAVDRLVAKTKQLQCCEMNRRKSLQPSQTQVLLHSREVEMKELSKSLSNTAKKTKHESGGANGTIVSGGTRQILDRGMGSVEYEPDEIQRTAVCEEIGTALICLQDLVASSLHWSLLDNHHIINLCKKSMACVELAVDLNPSNIAMGIETLRNVINIIRGFDHLQGVQVQRAALIRCKAALQFEISKDLGMENMIVSVISLKPQAHEPHELTRALCCFTDMFSHALAVYQHQAEMYFGETFQQENGRIMATLRDLFKMALAFDKNNNVIKAHLHAGLALLHLFDRHSPDWFKDVNTCLKEARKLFPDLASLMRHEEEQEALLVESSMFFVEGTAQKLKFDSPNEMIQSFQNCLEIRDRVSGPRGYRSIYPLVALADAYLELSSKTSLIQAQDTLVRIKAITDHFFSEFSHDINAVVKPLLCQTEYKIRDKPADSVRQSELERARMVMHVVMRSHVKVCTAIDRKPATADCSLVKATQALLGLEIDWSEIPSSEASSPCSMESIYEDLMYVVQHTEFDLGTEILKSAIDVFDCNKKVVHLARKLRFEAAVRCGAVGSHSEALLVLPDTSSFESLETGEYGERCLLHAQLQLQARFAVFEKAIKISEMDDLDDVLYTECKKYIETADGLVRYVREVIYVASILCARARLCFYFRADGWQEELKEHIEGARKSIGDSPYTRKRLSIAADVDIIEAMYLSELSDAEEKTEQRISDTVERALKVLQDEVGMFHAKLYVPICLHIKSLMAGDPPDLSIAHALLTDLALIIERATFAPEYIKYARMLKEACEEKSFSSASPAPVNCTKLIQLVRTQPSKVRMHLLMMKEGKYEASGEEGDLRGNIDHQCSNGRTALMFAVESGNYHVVRHLLEGNAEKDLVGASGETALSIALKKDDLNLVRLLLDHLVDIDSRDPLGLAVRNDQVEIAKLLLSHGAQPSGESASVQSPLARACSQGNAEMVELLLAQKVDPNGQSVYEYHSLLGCWNSESLECLEQVLEAGAQPDLEYDGMCVLSMITSHLCETASKLDEAASNRRREQDDSTSKQSGDDKATQEFHTKLGVSVKMVTMLLSHGAAPSNVDLPPSDAPSCSLSRHVYEKLVQARKEGTEVYLQTSSKRQQIRDKRRRKRQKRAKKIPPANPPEPIAPEKIISRGLKVPKPRKSEKQLKIERLRRDRENRIKRIENDLLRQLERESIQKEKELLKNNMKRKRMKSKQRKQQSKQDDSTSNSESQDSKILSSSSRLLLSGIAIQTHNVPAAIHVGFSADVLSAGSTHNSDTSDSSEQPFITPQKSKRKRSKRLHSQTNQSRHNHQSRFQQHRNTPNTQKKNSQNKRFQQISKQHPKSSKQSLRHNKHSAKSTPKPQSQPKQQHQPVPPKQPSQAQHAPPLALAKQPLPRKQPPPKRLQQLPQSYALSVQKNPAISGGRLVSPPVVSTTTSNQALVRQQHPVSYKSASAPCTPKPGRKSNSSTQTLTPTAPVRFQSLTNRMSPAPSNLVGDLKPAGIPPARVSSHPRQKPKPIQIDQLTPVRMNQLQYNSNSHHTSLTPPPAQKTSTTGSTNPPSVSSEQKTNTPDSVQPQPSTSSMPSPLRPHSAPLLKEPEAALNKNLTYYQTQQTPPRHLLDNKLSPEECKSSSKRYVHPNASPRKHNSVETNYRKHGQSPSKAHRRMRKKYQSPHIQPELLSPTPYVMHAHSHPHSHSSTLDISPGACNGKVWTDAVRRMDSSFDPSEQSLNSGLVYRNGAGSPGNPLSRTSGSDMHNMDPFHMFGYQPYPVMEHHTFAHVGQHVPYADQSTYERPALVGSSDTSTSESRSTSSSITSTSTSTSTSGSRSPISQKSISGSRYPEPPKIIGHPAFIVKRLLLASSARPKLVKVPTETPERKPIVSYPVPLPAQEPERERRKYVRQTYCNWCQQATHKPIDCWYNPEFYEK